MTRKLIAYRLSDQPMDIVRASLDRDWMTQLAGGHPYNCLPLNIANQSGWLLLCPTDLTLRWDGRDEADGVSVGGANQKQCKGHFGFGIVTFSIPYLIRTQSGYNLKVGGVPNLFRDGLQNLEAIVETDWAPQTFTVNLKITRPNHEIRLNKGEPIAMISPVKRGELESFTPEIKDIADNPDIATEYRDFIKKRAFQKVVNEKLKKKGEKIRTERDYLRGEKAGDAERFQHHQTKIRLKPFVNYT